VTAVTRGMRNAFRSVGRAISVVLILGLCIGLGFVTLIAYHSVTNRIAASLASIGNTVHIAAAGFLSAGSVNGVLATDQLSKLAHLPHVTDVDELLWSGVRPTGTTNQPSAPKGATVHSSPGPGSHHHTYFTSLRSPDKVDITCSNGTCSGDGLTSVGGGRPTLPKNFSPSVYFVGSNDPTNPNNINASALSIVAGHVIDGTGDADRAMVSTTMASKNHLKVGSTFNAFGKILTVAAIFDTNTEIGNDTVIVPLATEQRLSNQPHAVLGVVATADSLANLGTVTAEIKSALGSAADVTSNVAQAHQTMGQLNDAKRTSLESLAASVVAGAVIVFLIMVMIVRERKREIGILKAIGGSNARIMWQFVSEALTFTLLGAALGLIAGALAANAATGSILDHSGGSGSNASDGPYGSETAALGNLTGHVHAQATVSVVLLGLAAAILIALVGSAATSFLISRIQPAEVLRSE
jgi:putative ABC transport system permease protein